MSSEGLHKHFLEARNSWAKEVDGEDPKTSGRDRMGKKLVVTVVAPSLY